MKANENNSFQIDSVKWMREQRDKLSSKYIDNPEAEEEELKNIRTKFNFKTPIPK